MLTFTEKTHMRRVQKSGKQFFTCDKKEKKMEILDDVYLFVGPCFLYGT